MRSKLIVMMIIGFLLTLTIGCDQIATGTFVFSEEIDEEIQTSNTVIDMVAVDLTLNEDYMDHRDDIISVDEISIIGTFENMHSSNTASGEAWLAFYGGHMTADEVRDDPDAFLVFVSPDIAPGTTFEIEWSEAPVYMRNVDDFADVIIEDGQFWIYGLGSGEEFDFHIDVDILITVTIGYN